MRISRVYRDRPFAPLLPLFRPAGTFSCIKLVALERSKSVQARQTAATASTMPPERTASVTPIEKAPRVLSKL